MPSHIFPVITNIEELRQKVAHKEEIRFMTQPNGAIVCCYMVSAPTTFDDEWSREARGITFDQQGRVIGRPLSKFFNVNQKPETMAHLIDWSNVVRVMEKRDGSMIHTTRCVGSKFCAGANFAFKSKKSYTSDVVLAMDSWLMGESSVNQGINFLDYLRFCNAMTKDGQTAIFEFTSPIARIVLAYPAPSLTLLHVRDNYTGEYATRSQLESWSNQFNIPLVEDADEIMQKMQSLIEGHPVAVSFNKDGMIHGYTATTVVEYLDLLVEHTEDMEGWVFQFANGEMEKLKTKWYMDRHQAMTNLRTRDVAEMTLNETIDDLKSKLAGEGIDISPIEAIETYVVATIDQIINHVEETCATLKKEVAVLSNGDAHQDRKIFVFMLKKQEDPCFGLIMQQYSGVEPNYKGYFTKNYLSTYDLQQINFIDSAAEADDA